MRILSRHVTHYTAALQRTSPSYVQDALAMYALMPSLRLVPTIAHLTALCNEAKSEDDVQRLLSASSTLGLKRERGFYFALLFRLLSFPRVESRGSSAFLLLNRVVQSMQDERVVLDDSDLQAVLSVCRMKRNTSVGRVVWSYMTLVQLDIKGRFLHIVVILAAIKRDAHWLRDVYGWIHRAAPTGAVLRTVDGSITPWRGTYEELLKAQPLLDDPSQQFTFRLWLDMRATGREVWLAPPGSMHGLLLTAVKAALQQRVSAQDALLIEQLLQPVSTNSSSRPRALTADLVELLQAALQRYETTKMEPINTDNRQVKRSPRRSSHGSNSHASASQQPQQHAAARAAASGK